MSSPPSASAPKDGENHDDVRGNGKFHLSKSYKLFIGGQKKEIKKAHTRRQNTQNLPHPEVYHPGFLWE